MTETLLVFLCGVAAGILLGMLARWLGRKLSGRTALQSKIDAAERDKEVEGHRGDRAEGD